MAATMAGVDEIDNIHSSSATLTAELLPVGCRDPVCQRQQRMLSSPNVFSGINSHLLEQTMASAIGGRSEPLELFDASPVLANSRIAAYEWGSGELTLSPAAALSDKRLGRALIEVAHGMTSLELEQDLICLIAAVHEYRHFQQDMITGAGNWDYVSRIGQIVGRLSFVKNMSETGAMDSPLPPDIGRIADSDASWIFHRSSGHEIELIAEFLEEIGRPPAIAELFTTRRLLELDAVLYTYYLITSLRASQVAADNLEKLREYYFYLVMPEVYRETIMFCLNEILSHVKEDLDPVQRIENVTFSIRAMIAFSLAHPPPSHFESTDQSARDYIPGIRFLRLFLAAAQLMRDPQAGLFSIEKFEGELIGRCGYDYLPYPAVCSAWIDYFESLQPNPFSAVTEARREALRAKLHGENGQPKTAERLFRETVLGESILAFVELDLPLFTGGAERNALVLTRRALISHDYDIDRRRAVLAWRMSEFLIGKRATFLCPFAEGHCPIRIDRCKQPYQAIEEVPSTAECQIYQMCRDTDRRTFRI